MTPHINANLGDIAKTVIMPGDPKRVKYIAENFLENPKLVNEVRNIFAYTGKYKGKEVTVMASGMGMPSMAIYSYELYKFYEVGTIIRLGSCKSLKKEIELNDVIIADSAYTTSNFSENYRNEKTNIISSNDEVTNKIIETSKQLGLNTFKGMVYTSDIFYEQFENTNENIEKCLGVEMESFALFCIANDLGKKSSAILTVSDNIDVSRKLTPEERETGLNNAIKLALESII